MAVRGLKSNLGSRLEQGKEKKYFRGIRLKALRKDRLKCTGFPCHKPKGNEAKELKPWKNYAQLD